jgi:hypothetical protein
MSKASTAELLMVNLVNAEREKAGLEPLSVNDNLNTSSEIHSQWMLNNDVFDHTGANGSEPTDRIEQAGYKLQGSWSTAENIGWQSSGGAVGIEDEVRAIHENLMNSPGHRANILSRNVDEIGIGIETGEFNSASGEFDAVMVTQNFGKTDAPASAVMASQATTPPAPATAAPVEPATQSTANQAATATQTAPAIPADAVMSERSVQTTATSQDQASAEAWAFATSTADGQQSTDTSFAFESNDGMGNIISTSSDMTPAEIANIEAGFDSIAGSLGSNFVAIEDWSCPT